MKIYVLIFIVILLFSINIYALDYYDFQDLVGFTIIGCSYINGTFEGADFGKVISLDNGMVFEFTQYHYAYSYRPGVVILVKSITENNLIYRLIIKERIYKVNRLK